MEENRMNSIGVMTKSYFGKKFTFLVYVRCVYACVSLWFCLVETEMRIDRLMTVVDCLVLHR